MNRLARVGIFTSALLAEPAHATWSIVAVDTQTGELGGAGASCVGRFDVGEILDMAVGHGAIHAQAALNFEARDRGAELLAAGASPLEVIAAIANASFDSSFQERQFGVVDLSGRTAAFTGSATNPYAGHFEGNDGRFAFSIQGNLLTSERVLTRARDAFGEGACDLAAKLIAALAAGRQGGEGDGRCTPRGYSADSAFIEVDRSDEPRGTFLSISHVDTSPADSVVDLTASFESWRASHPCPGPRDAGAPDESFDEVLDASPGPERAPLEDATADGGSDAEAKSAEAKSMDALTNPSTAGGVDGRCGCRTTRSVRPIPVVTLILLGLTAVLRRGPHRSK
ncbi:MAG: DUF1028 domain-containing protein [Deltaproteobacteria bacterium]|nr:DUF1028 domain-containing protein [Deltaproteobacteria bacterium]